ncbi:hypothetical protein V8C86DRAFT_2697586 [Haematococcus lacustris]
MQLGMKSVVPALLLLALLCMSQEWGVAANDPPSGSFRDSCSHCEWASDTTFACGECKKSEFLTAFPGLKVTVKPGACGGCRTGSGMIVLAGITGANTCGYVSNCDGVLKCTRRC